jgi:hypothetical protein
LRLLHGSRSRPSTGFIAGLVVLGLSSTNTPVAAGDSSAQQIQTPEIQGLLERARESTSLGLSAIYEVKGETLFSYGVLAANEIVFEPGSSLLFSEEALAKAKEVFIIAQSVRVLGDQPATVTWVRVERDRVPPPRGKASPGALMGPDGADGLPGAEGEPGNVGFPGTSAPAIHVLIGRVSGPGLLVDVRGQAGGPGGKGQSGGDGGAGRSGSRAIRATFNCVKTAGRGGNGGPGGRGGPGGTGGSGGNGGSVLIVSTERGLKPALEFFKVTAEPGTGGPGGPGGDGGAGGKGGRKGEISPPFCTKSAADGTDGDNGADGPPGDPGASGLAGQFLYSALTDDQWKRVLSPRASKY